MKRIILYFCLYVNFASYAQKLEHKKKVKKNEIKVTLQDATNFQPLLLYGVSYEKFFSKKQSLGFELLSTKSVDKNDSRNLSISAIYTGYYSSNHRGFFNNAFLMYTKEREDEGSDNFYLGGDIGYKLLIVKHITVSAFLGFGFDIPKLSRFNFDIIARTGISLGYRF